MAKDTDDVKQMSNEKRFEHLDQELGQVKEDVAGLKTGFHALTASFTQLGNDITRRFDQMQDYVKENKPKPMNWLGMFAILISLVGASAGYVTTRLTPTEKTVEKLRQLTIEDFAFERDQAFELGKTSAQVNTNTNEIAALRAREIELESEVAALEAQIHYMRGDEFRAKEVGDKMLEAIGRLEVIEKELDRLNGVRP